ncbi:RelA/SpoT family protein [Thiofilum flexile]|uniref:RelA/SpoT family protein n=1 Tax=Thiofilum flexile TaxID=125627 RepID=UPI000369BFEC|nr:RelA/SpoT family protein [Thiofilum flexile]
MQHSRLTDPSAHTLDSWVQLFWTSGRDQDELRIRHLVDQLLTKPLDLSSPLEPSGLEMAEILLHLEVDQSTLIAALCADNYFNFLKHHEINEQFGVQIAIMVDNIRTLQHFTRITEFTPPDPEPAAKSKTKHAPHSNGEQLRRMILAIVKDLRVVLIKLAWQLQYLRLLSQCSSERELQMNVARQTLEVYAPLASRLGISQIKWELEDLAFRFQQPDIYKRIAKALAFRRLEREHYIESVIQCIRELLDKEEIEASVYGRPKHIYSIWRKMTRKKIDMDQLFDLRAIRIMVDTVDTCYRVVSLIHDTWNYLEEEYDDYISNRKANGYQSIHTVVLGPKDHYIEIQIRTYDMHHFAESGVASHWNYKEGGKNKQHQVMDSLRQSLEELLERNRGDDEYLLEDFHNQVYSNSIFVMTPKSKVIELSKGATPLDFAYAIHTDIGHRCLGAKVNGDIVPLNYELTTGQQVEILTGKEARPKMNWTNIALGYAKSARTRQKINHWFRQQDHEKNRTTGIEILEHEKHILNLPLVKSAELYRSFGRQSERDFLIALGRGEISTQQLVEHLVRSPERDMTLRKVRPPKDSVRVPGGIEVAGVKDLFTQIARCCKPVYGDTIIGFITQGKGISVHRTRCSNITSLGTEQQARLIEVSWVGEASVYVADIVVSGYNEHGLLRDITSALFRAHIVILSLNSRSLPIPDDLVIIDLTVQIDDASQLADVLERLIQIPAVTDAQRKSNL